MIGVSMVDPKWLEEDKRKRVREWDIAAYMVPDSSSAAVVRALKRAHARIDELREFIHKECGVNEDRFGNAMVNTDCDCHGCNALRFLRRETPPEVKE